MTEEFGFSGIQDPDLPPTGQGFFYLMQAQNFDCGLGSLGFASSEQERTGGGPAACQGIVQTDTYASSEETLSGSVSGDLSGTLASDNLYETFSGNIDHRWTLQVPPGSRQEFHIESFYDVIPAFEYSTDGLEFTLIHRLILFSFEDDDTDQVAVLPSDLAGTVIIRLTPAGPAGPVSVDELFIRTIP